MEPGETKNGQGRRFPMTKELRSLLEEQKVFVSSLEREYSKLISRVFVHSDESVYKINPELN